MKKAYVTAVQSVSYGTATTEQAAKTLYQSMQDTLTDIVE